jgi:hypothetical protein
LDASEEPHGIFVIVLPCHSMGGSVWLCWRSRAHGWLRVP